MSARLLVSCGEPSGDVYAGALVRELQRIDPGISVSGLGGPRFAAAGGRLLEDYRGLSVTGLTEVVRKLPRAFATLWRLVRAARRERPDALVVIDFPDFNFVLARRLHALGIPVVYYISPQIWAWRPTRLHTIRAFADLVLVIFPFEAEIYRAGGVPVEFVGHPLLDLLPAVPSRAAFLGGLGFSTSAPTIALLPGSRPNEVAHILPDLVAAARHIAAVLPTAQFIVARAPNLDDRHFAALSAGAPTPRMAVVVGQTDAVLASSDVVLTASGTATVQTALWGTPMVVVYRVSPVTYRLVRRRVTVSMVAMVNLIAGRVVVPELIQDAFTPEAVAREALDILTNTDRAAVMRADLAEVRTKLGGPGASRRAAEAILRVVERR
ncbi:MAG: lipid-A-disaccharide synthase [Acidobacteriota bacterium]